jgi:hypothetical protein
VLTSESLQRNSLSVFFSNILTRSPFNGSVSACYFSHIEVGAGVGIITNMNLEGRKEGRKRLTYLGTPCISSFILFSGCLEDIIKFDSFAPYFIK